MTSDLDPVGRMRFPHPLALLMLCVLLAAALTHILPSGRYDRTEDPVTGRTAVVPGTYHRVDPTPVSPWKTLVAVQKGFISAASIIGFIFLVGGAFSVVEQTGALTTAVEWIVIKFQHRPVLVIIVSCIFFSAGGFIEGMSEEILAFIPILLLLVSRLGYDRLTAVAMSLGAAIVGSAMSAINPFTVGIGQTIAQLPLLSGAGFRIAFYLPALALYIWYTTRYAARTRTIAEAFPADMSLEATPTLIRIGRRSALVLIAVVLAFAVLIFGVLKLEWGIDELAGLFFGMGILAGLIGGLGIRGTSEGFVKGFAGMSFAALIIGFARAILVVLEQGQIIDTIVAGLFAPLSRLPVTLAAIGMLGAHSLIHLPIPSWTGQAMVTLPILVPLSDLLGLSRQVTVLSYQYGAGFLDILWPTQGTLLAMLALCDVPYERWVKFAIKITLILLAWMAIAIAVAVAIGLT